MKLNTIENRQATSLVINSNEITNNGSSSNSQTPQFTGRPAIDNQHLSEYKNGLLSPALSSSGGEGEEPANSPVTGRHSSPFISDSPASSLEFPVIQGWPSPVDGSALLSDIGRLLERFVVLPKWGAETMALWILHTYAFHLRDVTTYIGLESPEKRCGKTTLLTVLCDLVNRPVVAANISSSAFFRLIGEARPTLLIDEADTFLQGNDELRGILNSGYKRKTAFVVRVTNEIAKVRVDDRGRDGRMSLVTSCGTGEGGRDQIESLVTSSPTGEGSRLARFSCWCPKIMAAIGRLPDTLADRCIVIRMQRKTSREQCERLRNLDTADLRRKCVRFIADHANAIAAAQPELPDGLNDRATDIWEPLFALADLAGGVWPKQARAAAMALNSGAQDADPISSLLLDILLTFSIDLKNRMFSRDLIAGLANRATDRPWAEACKGKPITELWLAAKLRPYGIRPKTIWIDDRHAKGYLLDDFTETFRRYIPKAEAESFIAECRQGSNPQDAEALSANSDIQRERLGEDED